MKEVEWHHKKIQGLECGSAVVCLPSMWEVLGSIPSISKNKTKSTSAKPLKEEKDQRTITKYCVHASCQYLSKGTRIDLKSYDSYARGKQDSGLLYVTSILVTCWRPSYLLSSLALWAIILGI